MSTNAEIYRQVLIENDDEQVSMEKKFEKAVDDGELVRRAAYDLKNKITRGIKLDERDLEGIPVDLIEFLDEKNLTPRTQEYAEHEGLSPNSFRTPRPGARGAANPTVGFGVTGPPAAGFGAAGRPSEPCDLDRDCLGGLDADIDDLNLELPPNHQLPSIDIDRACTEQMYLGEYEVLLKQNMTGLYEWIFSSGVHAYAEEGGGDKDFGVFLIHYRTLSMGGGKINQKGGFGSRNQLIKFLLKLSRFIRRAAACTLLVGAAEQAKNIIMLLILKLSGSAVTTAATAVKTTGFMAATAAAAPSIATVVGTIPVAILAGVLGAGLLELAIYLSSDDWRRDLSWTELKRIEDRIKESEAAAAKQDLEAAARIMEENYERDKENYKLRADLNVALADARLARFSAFKDDVVLINQRCKQVFVVYRLSSQVIININDVVNYIAYLPDNMFEDARSIVENEDPNVKIEGYRALKSKSQLLLLLMGFGLDLDLIKILMVPLVARKFGNNIYELASIVYKAGIGGEAHNTATLAVNTMIDAVNEIALAAKSSEVANNEDIAAHFTGIKEQIEKTGNAAAQYGELIQKSSAAPDRVKEIGAAAAAARQFANSQVQPGSDLAVHASPSEIGAGAGPDLVGGSRRRRKNNKPRKRRTLRKKSKRRKSTKRNSRKTTVRRKSKRLSRKSKRLSRKLKK